MRFVVEAFKSTTGGSAPQQTRRGDAERVAAVADQLQCTLRQIDHAPRLRVVVKDPVLQDRSAQLEPAVERAKRWHKGGAGGTQSARLHNCRFLGCPQCCRWAEPAYPRQPYRAYRAITRQDIRSSHALPKSAWQHWPSFLPVESEQTDSALLEQVAGHLDAILFVRLPSSEKQTRQKNRHHQKSGASPENDNHQRREERVTRS